MPTDTKLSVSEENPFFLSHYFQTFTHLKNSIHAEGSRDKEKGRDYRITVLSDTRINCLFLSFPNSITHMSAFI